MYKGKRTSMWRLIPQKRMPPTRNVRYCCKILKESAGDGRYIATGVRWAESTYRSTRAEFEKNGKNKREVVKFSTIMLMNDNDARRRMTEACMQKRKMTWNTYMSLILFFDYNPNTHYTIRQLDAFPYRLDECWLSGKMDQANGE